MLILAHTGITVGCVWLGLKATARGTAAPEQRQSKTQAALHRLQEKLDYRLLAVGALLPDIIDKPLGLWLLGDEISNGRIFGHTLLFIMLLAAAGTWLYTRRRSLGMLVLAFGALSHLILDQMWLSTQTLFWPLFGWEFEKRVYDDWLGGIWEALLTNPGVFIPEIIGGLLLAAFFWDIIRQGRLRHFLLTGRVN